MAIVKAEPELQKWLDVVSSYENEFKKWEGRVTKILKRYRDDTRSPTGNETAKFNILWSNVQTLIPAVYSRMPKADVSRRFNDTDPTGRVASLLLERSLNYEIEHYPDFRSTMRHSVEDRFLGGRGVGWVRYEPHIVTQEEPEDGLEVTDAVEGKVPEAGTPEEPKERIDYECSPVDYVHWKDFGHSGGRIWEEVEQSWRWVYMDEAALKARGFKDWKKIPLDSSPTRLNTYMKETSPKDKAKICELWDRASGKVYWFCKSYNKILDVRDDPLKLECFFPCARPLFATTTSDSLVPVPDFTLYQDQANELDILSDRIDGLVKALRVRGVYNSSIPELQRLLTEGDNNTLIPVASWGAFAEKGGLKGAIELLPIDDLSATLLQCHQARADIKGQVYEITGISDIIRGESVASETATAQQIKGQYAGLRLKSMQESVAVFASELIRNKAQIICTKYQPETIMAYADVTQFSEADKALVPQALQLLKSNPLRCFRIEVDADSLVQLDEAQDKADAIEFLKAFGQYMEQAVPAGASTPELIPMLMGGARFLVSRFKQAKSMEGVIDSALQALQAKAQQNAQNPQPSKEMQEAQAKGMLQQAQGQIDLQIAQLRNQATEQASKIAAQGNAQLEQMRIEHQERVTAMKLAQEDAFNRWEAQLSAATSIEVALIGKAASDAKVAQAAADTETRDLAA